MITGLKTLSSKLACEPAKPGVFAGGAVGESRMSVEAGADGGAADSEIIETVESDGNAAAITVEKTDPAGNFLAESERRGVLQVRAADLDNVGKFFGFDV